MRTLFYGKRVAFLGDSIVQHGTFLDFMRARLDGIAGAPRLYNRGLGGNRSIMVEGLFADEIASLRPDVTFVHYGVNDLGVWLYDTALEVTPAVLAERRERDEAYRAGLVRTVALIREAGITPVLCTPIPLDGYLREEEDIVTLADNREKGERIRDTLYRRATFARLNEALSAYRETVFAIAADGGAEVCDLGAAFLTAQTPEGGLYQKDGTHLSRAGNVLLAQCFLSHMGVAWDGCTPPLSPRHAALREREQTERSVQYVKWALFHPMWGRDVEDSEVGAAALLEAPTLERHKRLAIEDYLKNGKSAEGLRAEIEALQ